MLKVWAEVEVSASSLEEALELAKALTPSDFYNATGEVMEHSHRLVGVTDSQTIDV